MNGVGLDMLCQEMTTALLSKLHNTHHGATEKTATKEQVEKRFSNHGSYFMSFLRYSVLKNIVTLKSGSKVTQGHLKWYHLIDCVWFPITVL